MQIQPFHFIGYLQPTYVNMARRRTALHLSQIGTELKHPTRNVKIITHALFRHLTLQNVRRNGHSEENAKNTFV